MFTEHGESQVQAVQADIQCADEEILSLLDFAKPDPLILPEWYSSSPLSSGIYNSKEGSVVPLGSAFDSQECEVVVVDLDDSTCNNNNNDNQYVWDLMGSCVWNSMPGAYQLSDLQANFEHSRNPMTGGR